MSRSSGAAPGAGAEQRIERRVRGLGAAGDERDATGRHAREPRDVASRVLDDPARRPPSACTDEGLPVVSIAASAASRASGRNGAVAL